MFLAFSVSIFAGSAANARAMGNAASSAEAPQPRQELPQAAAAPSSSSACPVVGDAGPAAAPRRGQPVYNVYNQRIDEDAAASASGTSTGAQLHVVTLSDVNRGFASLCAIRHPHDSTAGQC